MNELKHKTVLLIVPFFFNYHNEIKEKLEKKGASVVIMNADPSKFMSFIISTLKHFFRTDLSLVRCMEIKSLRRIKRLQFDYVITVCGWRLTSYFFNIVKNHHLHNNGKMILYYWDSVALLHDDPSRRKYFDKVVSFDKNDCDEWGFSFLPLFWCDVFRGLKNDEELKYDLMTVGSFKMNRYITLKEIKNRNPSIRIKYFIYHNWSIVFHKLRKKYRNVDLADIVNTPLTLTEMMQEYSKSIAILDIQRTGQFGLTMRTFECLAMQKKVITTNPTIREYDFYCPDNFYVLDLDQLKLPDSSWFEKPYRIIPNEIIEKYSIEEWINNLVS